MKGIAFVSYATTDGVRGALQRNGDDYWGRKLRVQVAHENSYSRETDVNNEFRVFMKNLPLDTAEDELRKDFEVFGDIEELKAPKDEQGKFRGFAFIAFKSKEAAEKSLTVDGSKYGQEFVIEMARPIKLRRCR